MKLSLKEFEKVLDYAQLCADELEFKYYLNVKVKVYRMYDGRAGVSLQLFDKYGNFFKEYRSGIYTSTDGYIKAIKNNYFRIKEEAREND